MSQAAIYWQLLALTAAVFVIGWLVGRSRLGLAARVIGDDEVVARHSGIDTTRAKVALFALSSGIMALTGAIMAPRWTYIDPAIAFNPMISFQVVIMALLGGAGALFGPALGAIPLVLLFEVLTANFPNAFSILLGVAFILIVYCVPRGVIGLLEDWWPGRVRPKAAVAGAVRDRAQHPCRRGTAKILRRPARRRRRLLPGRARRDRGADRAQRLGQDDGAQPDLGRASGRTQGASVSWANRSRAPNPTASRPAASPERSSSCACCRSMSLADNVSASLAFRALPATGAAARAAAERLLARVGLQHRLETRASELTYIDQKRLELVRALALEPKLLLLDEWLAGLNPTELEEGISLIQSLRQDGVSIVMVEHVMDAIRALCDRCIVMSAGRRDRRRRRRTRRCGSPEVVRAYLGEADA